MTPITRALELTCPHARLRDYTAAFFRQSCVVVVPFLAHTVRLGLSFLFLLRHPSPRSLKIAQPSKLDDDRLSKYQSQPNTKPPRTARNLFSVFDNSHALTDRLIISSHVPF